MKALYNRVSTKEQNILNQTDKATDERIYLNVCSGTIAFEDRVFSKIKTIKAFGGSAELIEDIKKGDITSVKVYSIDRLGRNLIDVLQTVNFFTQNQVNLYVENLGLHSLIDGKESGAFKMILSVMATISEMERNTMLERQKIGIKKAQESGKYKGRVAGAKKTDEKFLFEYKNVVKEISLNPALSLRKIAKITNVSVSTVQKVKRLKSNQINLLESISEIEKRK